MLEGLFLLRVCHMEKMKVLWLLALRANWRRFAGESLRRADEKYLVLGIHQ
jgi:hypothetical protein